MTYLMLIPSNHVSYGITDKLLVILNMGQFARLVVLGQIIILAILQYYLALLILKKYPYRWNLVLAAWGMGISMPFLLATVAIDKFLIGLLWLPVYIAILFGVGRMRSKNKYLGICVAIILVVMGIMSSWQLMNNLDIAYRINKDHLNRLPKDAVVVCFNEQIYYSLVFLQKYQHVREDVLLVSDKKVPTLPIFNYETYPENISDYIGYLIQTKKVFFSDVDAGYWRYLGVEGKPFYIVPNGMWWELTTYRPQTENIALPMDYWGLSKNPKKYKWYRDIYERYLISKKVAREILAGMGKVGTIRLIEEDVHDGEIFNGGYQPVSYRVYNASEWVFLATSFSNMGDNLAKCVSFRAANRINRYRMDVHQSLADCYKKVGDERMYENEKRIIEALINFK